MIFAEKEMAFLMVKTSTVFPEGGRVFELF